MKRNVGSIDRILRVVIGLALIVLLVRDRQEASAGHIRLLRG